MCILKNLFLGKFGFCVLPTSEAMSAEKSKEKENLIKCFTKLEVVQKSKCVAVLEPKPRN